MNKKIIMLLAILALSQSQSYAQDLPISENITVPMTLDFANAEAADFRGTTASADSSNCLEDCQYKLDENSLIYKGEGTSAGVNSVMSGAPSIQWTVTDSSNTDSPTTLGDAQNSQSAGTNFPNPGHYKVSNSGYRQLSDAGGMGGKGSATANAAKAVVVHDCTVPDIWIAIEEYAGSGDLSENSEQLQTAIATKILSNGGSPFVASKDDSSLEKTNYIFIDESPRDAAPSAKVVRFTIAGNMFNANGATDYKSTSIKTSSNGGDKTQQAVITGNGEDESGFSGLYVRRNIPFVVASKAVDNGDRRASSTDANFRIKDSNGNVIEPTSGSYMFRVPNYPRSEYPDQPEYFFEAQAVDSAGNMTKIEAPIHVIEQSASFDSNSSSK